MELPNNGVYGAPTRHLSSPNEASSSRNWIHLIQVVNPRSPMKIPKQSTLLVVLHQLIDCKALLLKTTPTQLIEHRPMEPSPLQTSSVHGTGRYSAHCPRRNVKTNPATNSSINNGDLSAGVGCPFVYVLLVLVHK